MHAAQVGAGDGGREQERQRALDAYHLVDTLPEAVYDDIVRVAAALCGTPIALVSLLDRDRQWFKARTGLEATGTARDIAVCDHAIRQADQLFEVPDLARDARFAANPLVTGELQMRFYAGMPLVTPDGHAIGTVCVIDREPRELTEAQRDALRGLSRIAMALIEAGGTRRRQLQESLHSSSGLRSAGTASGPGFVAAIVELQGHADVVARIGEDATERLLHAMEEALALLLPAGCPGAVYRNPGSAECSLVFEGADAGAVLRSVAAFVERHARDTGTRILLGAAHSEHPDEPMPDVFLRADQALSAAKDDARR